MILMWPILGGMQVDGSSGHCDHLIDQDGKVLPNLAEPLWIRTGVETGPIMVSVYQEAAAAIVQLWTVP